MAKYPSRQSHHAHRLTRLLFKGCAAQSIGHHAVCLVIHIAHTEDAARYQGPVRFWNSQLMEVLGFKSPKQLNNARDAAIKAGWLIYERSNDRTVGHYWTQIPESVSRFSDEPIEAMHSESGKLSDNGTQSGTQNGKHSESGTRSGTHSGMHCGTRSGKPSNPNPIPNPISGASLFSKVSFSEFWDAYPKRDGRKLGKAEAEAEFSKLNPAEHEALMIAVQNLAKSGQKPKDAFRFLKRNSKGNQPWREWLAPVQPDDDDDLPEMEMRFPAQPTRKAVSA